MDTKMKKININSYAKINLSIDVLGKLENGYHQVEMVMQQVELHDDVSVKWMEADSGVAGNLPLKIEVKTNRHYLPTDERNLAYKAARLMADKFAVKSGEIRIDIKKRIPVAAGMAGGSGNGAAVVHALNKLWNLKLTWKELCEISAPLGSDMPFCIMGQARSNPILWGEKDLGKKASSCASASGTGTALVPIKGLNAYILLTKPPISVSTSEVYKGLDMAQIHEHPNTEQLINALKTRNYEQIQKNMRNVLEIFTLKRYPSVVYTKNKILEESAPFKVMMSGSGPTVFAVFMNKKEAMAAYQALRSYNKETYLTHTTK